MNEKHQEKNELFSIQMCFAIDQMEQKLERIAELACVEGYGVGSTCLADIQGEYFCPKHVAESGLVLIRALRIGQTKVADSD